MKLRHNNPEVMERKQMVKELFESNSDMPRLEMAKVIGCNVATLSHDLSDLRLASIVIKDKLPRGERRVVRMKTLHPERSNVEIGRRLKMHPANVSRTLIKHGLNKKRSELQVIDDDCKEIIRELFTGNDRFPRNEILPILLDRGMEFVTKKKIDRYIGELREAGLIIKHKSGPSPRAIVDARRRAVSILLEQNPLITQASMSRKLKVSKDVISDDVRSISRRIQREQAENYELYKQRQLGEIAMVKQECLDRFKASPRSSSRWLEVFLQASEKEAKLLGLNAPERKIIDATITDTTKEERDKVIDAFFTVNGRDTDGEMINVTPNTKAIVHMDGD